MMKLNIKPLSVNQAWKGKRYKSDLYKSYETAVLKMLPNVKAIEPPFKFEFTFGFSNSGSDIDNPLKPIIDIIQKKYKINDKDIYELIVKKDIVKKGYEYIEINISTLL